MKKNLIVLALFLLLISGCGTNAVTSNYSTSESKTREQQTYHINEDIYVKKNSGEEYRLKINSINETYERNEFSDTRADRVVVIDYEYENISLSDDLFISSWDFQAYDQDNNALETYEVIDYKYPDNISMGRKTTAQLVFALNNTNNYIELEYYDNVFWDSQSVCKIVLEW